MADYICAPTSGTIKWINFPSIPVEAGKSVACILGAAAQEHLVFASVSGRASKVMAVPDQIVRSGDRLIEVVQEL